MDKLKLKLESVRNGKSWNDIESDGNNQVSEFYAFHGFLHHSNLTSLFLLFLVFLSEYQPYEELHFENPAVGG
jgi:hypothetical protein